MITYIKEAKQYEKEIIQKYVAKCYILYGSAIITFILNYDDIYIRTYILTCFLTILYRISIKP